MLDPALPPDDEIDFEAIFAAAPNLYLLLNPDFVIVGASNAYLAATMTERASLIGSDLFEAFPDNPEDIEATGVSNLRASLLRVLRSRQPDAMPTQKYDIPRPADEGGGFEERYWSPLNTPILDSNGEVRWIVHRVEDVTRFVRMQTEDQLAQRAIAELEEANATLESRDRENAKLQSELLLRTTELVSASSFLNLVVEHIPAMVAVKDATDLRFVLLNREGEELTGIPRAESLGKSDHDFFPPEQAEFFVARDREVLDSGQLQIIPEELIQTRHKGLRVLRTTKLPVPDEHGRPKFLLAMSEDITDRKRAESALAASEALFRSLLAASPDAMLVIDTQGKILIASDRVEVIYGYKPEELVGQYTRMLRPARLNEAYAARLRALVDAEPAVTRSSTEDLVGLRRDGTEFPMEVMTSPHMTAEGKVLIVAIRDISDRRAVETQLRQALKMEAIGNLTGGLAHDFNNLLGVIIGNLDLLSEELGGDPDSVALAEQALAAALRGADLTRRLLAFARRQPLQPQLVDLNGLVEGISLLMRRTLGENIEIEHQLDPNVWRVTVDPVQFEACLVNLFTNARDAMPDGGSLQMTTGNRRLDADYVSLYPELLAGDYAVVEVTDTGTGMSRDMLDKIFEPFFTTKTDGRGTGLGLSMVFGFMKQSGGHINVYSEPDVGTTFRLYLPRAESEAAAFAPRVVAVDHVGGSETILAVEDNADLRELVVRQLTQLGYTCLEAGDGPSALRILAENHVDLLFTDVIMPGGMSGYDLGRAAKLKWPHLKVLLTSGFPEEKLNGNGQPPWNMRLLTKPYRKQDLAQILRELIEADD